MKRTLLLLGVFFLHFVVAGCTAEESATEPLETRTTELRKERISCGGFAGLACPDGYTCVDVKNDGCDPNNGGADCPGECKRDSNKPSAGGGKKDCGNKQFKTYVSRDTTQCAAIRFVCGEGESAFFDDCGCGCLSGESCGASICGSDAYCCNESCGICAPLDGVCTQQVCY